MRVAGLRVAGYGVDQLDKNHDGKWPGHARDPMEFLQS